MMGRAGLQFWKALLQSSLNSFTNLNQHRKDQMEISKRDYFAAQALTGLLARSGGPGKALGSHEAAATEAFIYADAMLKLSKTLLDPVEIDPEQLGRGSAPLKEQG
jgi:hypothetical protein